MLISKKQNKDKHIPKIKAVGIFLLQAGTYAILNPYILSFHIRGGARYKNQFFGMFGPKSQFLVKKLTFKVLMNFISSNNAVSENNLVNLTSF